MKPTLAIRSHLGLGDNLVCNAIFRKYAEKFSITIPCKERNVPSVKFMLKDVEGVTLIPIGDGTSEDDHHADDAIAGMPSMKLGFYGPRPFDPERWDSEMYRQASVPFEDRWDKFVYHDPATKSSEEGQFIFLHDDESRGFNIDQSLLPDVRIVRPRIETTPNIFDTIPLMRAASEIHCIDSCFAILADSIEGITDKLFLHWYARYDKPPHYRKNWTIVT